MADGCLIIPEWPVPETVQSVISTRFGGVSQPPFESFNLATQVDDDIIAVQENRRRLQKQAVYLTNPQWLNQVHGSVVVAAETDGVIREADGSYSHQSNRICVVQTADCLPILLCDTAGTQVAALHAGWRGLAAGIVVNGVATFTSGYPLMAYLGPAISQLSFEVGEDVRNTFRAISSLWGGEPLVDACFRQTSDQHWLADIYGLARLALLAAGVEQVYGGDFCTYSDKEGDAERFYSFRREGVTGRMASLIWLSA